MIQYSTPSLTVGDIFFLPYLTNILQNFKKFIISTGLLFHNAIYLEIHSA